MENSILLSERVRLTLTAESIQKIIDFLAQSHLRDFDAIMTELAAQKQMSVEQSAKKEAAKPTTDLDLSYNQYKGTGKCWVQCMVNGAPTTFVNAIMKTPRDGYSGTKTFRLGDGEYRTCESGSKSSDKRVFITVKDSKITEH